MKRAILDSISTIRPSGLGANSAARAIRRIVNDEGPQCVSVDDDGQVFCTPRDCDFSQALLRTHAGNVAGVYDKDLDLDGLADDLATQVSQLKAA
jgi:hypothetical protein